MLFDLTVYFADGMHNSFTPSLLCDDTSCNFTRRSEASVRTLLLIPFSDYLLSLERFGQGCDLVQLNTA